MTTTTTGHVIGYRRVSTADQRLDRQTLDGCDRIFEDKASGKDAQRPGLEDCLRYCREGDTLRVHSIDRLARSLHDLITLVDGLTARGVRVEFAKEGLAFDAADPDPSARFYMQVLGAAAEWERSIIRARQEEGIAVAKERGVYKGRQPALSPAEVATARQRRALGVPLARLQRDYGVSKATITAALAGRGVYAGEAYTLL